MNDHSKPSLNDWWPHLRSWLIYGGLSLLGLFLLDALLAPNGAVQTVPYSQFQKWLDQGRISDLTVGQSNIIGTFHSAKGETQQFSTDRVDPAIAQALDRKHVTYSGEPQPSIFFNILSWLAPFIVLALVWRYLMVSNARTRGGGILPISASKARVYAEKAIKTAFDDMTRPSSQARLVAHG